MVGDSKMVFEDGICRAKILVLITREVGKKALLPKNRMHVLLNSKLVILKREILYIPIIQHKPQNKYRIASNSIVSLII